LIASKLLDEAENDPKSRANVTKLNTAIAYFSDVLKEQGIDCSINNEIVNIEDEEASVPFIVISPDGDHYLNKFAATMNELKVDLVFHPYSLIDNEAAAMFEPGEDKGTRSRMVISREFIEEYGGSDKMSIKHEMRHFLSYILAVMGYDSIYAGEIRFKVERLDNKAYKAGFVLDELPAWSEDIYESARRFNASFKKLYLGFHPEIGTIASELRTYLNNNAAYSALDAVETKKQIMNFIYFYADGIDNTEGRISKLDDLLNYFYLPQDKNKKDLMREKILALANRDLMFETEEEIKNNPSATYYDPIALGKRLSDIDFILRSISSSSNIMDKLSSSIESSLNSILSRKGTLSYTTKTKPGYKLSIKYTTGMIINYKWSNNSITNKKVHLFEVEGANNISSYKVKITARDENEDLKEVLFKRVEEQIAISKIYNEKNQKILSEAKSYIDAITPSEDKNLSPKELALLMKEKMPQILEMTKELSDINKDSFSNDIDLKEVIPVWRKYIESLEPKESTAKKVTKVKKNTKVNKPKNNNDDDTQFCEVDFSNPKKVNVFNKVLKTNKNTAPAVMLELSAYLGGSTASYEEQVDLLLKNIAENDLKLGDAELDLLFGKKDEMGERAGGLIDLWMDAPDEGNNRYYIALAGASAYGDHSSERSIARSVTRAYSISGLINLPSADIVYELQTKDLVPMNIDKDLMIRRIDAIKLVSPKTRSVSR